MADGRSILMSLSEEGERLISLDDKLFSKLTEKVQQALIPKDYVKLEQLLNKVSKSL